MSTAMNPDTAARQLEQDLGTLYALLHAPWQPPSLRRCWVAVKPERLASPAAAHALLAQWLAEGATGWLETSAAAQALLPGQSPALQPEADLPLAAELALPGQALRLVLSDDGWLATTTHETNEPPAPGQAEALWATRHSVMSTLAGQTWRYQVYHRLGQDGGLHPCGQRLEALR